MAVGDKLYFPEQSSTAEAYDPKKIYKAGEYFVKQGKFIHVDSAEKTGDWELVAQDLTKATIYTCTFFGKEEDLGFTILSTSVKFKITLADGTVEQVVPTSYNDYYKTLYTPKFNILKNNKTIIRFNPRYIEYGNFIGLICVDADGNEHDMMQKKTCSILCVEGLNAPYMKAPDSRGKVEIDGIVRDDLPDNTTYFGWPVTDGEVDNYPENAVRADYNSLYLLNKTSLTSYKTESPIMEYEFKEVNMFDVVKTRLEDKDPLVKHTLTIALSNTSNTIDSNADRILTIGSSNKMKNGTSYSAAIGYGNELNGSNQLAVGSSNVLDNASNSVALGYGNYVHGESLAAGSNNNRGNSDAGYYLKDDYYQLSSYSIALGDSNDVWNQDSAALGYKNTVIGQCSVAAGDGNVAMDRCSFAFGDHCLSQGQASVAIGKVTRTLKNASYSVALGYDTVAAGTNGSFACGDVTSAVGTGSFAIGNHTFAIGMYSYCGGGGYSYAFGTGSHAEGDSCYAYGERSFVFGNSCSANEYNTLAMGNNCQALNSYDIALGYYSSANGNGAIAMGVLSKANGASSMGLIKGEAHLDNSVAIGEGAYAAAQYATAFGKYVCADTKHEFVIGKYNKAKATNIETKHFSKYINVKNVSRDFYGNSSKDKYTTNKTKNIQFKFKLPLGAKNVVCSCTGFESSDFSYSSYNGIINVYKNVESEFGKQFSINCEYDLDREVTNDHRDSVNNLFVIGNGSGAPGDDNQYSNAFVVNKDGKAFVNDDLFVKCGKDCEEGLKVATENLLGDAYDNTATYAVDDIVIYNNTLYKCKEAIDTAEDFDADKWEATKITNLLGGGGDSTLTDETTGVQYKIFVNNGIIGLREV